MLKSILVGLDGSPSSGAAVELGIQWAKQFNALLGGIGHRGRSHHPHARTRVDRRKLVQAEAR